MGRSTASSVEAALESAGTLLGRIGSWGARRSYWVFFLLSCIVVLAKTAFKWAGTTGDGWFLEFRPVIDAWPLKELLVGSDQSSAWQENYSPIVVFKVVTRLGLPYNSFTWNLIHIAASLGAMLALALWIRRTYGDDTGRLITVLVVFGAAPMILLQEIGRYDSFFFLGAVLLATSRRWWNVLIGALVVGTSSWAMGLGFVGSLFLVGLVLGSRTLTVRGIVGLFGCVAGAGLLMLARISQGGDPALVRLGKFGEEGAGKNFSGIIYQVWLNTVQPFPNWIWAAYGLTWVLFALVLIQARRRRILLGICMVALPLIAGSTNAGDGTREIALTFAATLFAVATTLQRRSREPSDTPPIGTPSPVVLGLIMVLAVVLPVIDINPNEPINPWGWLGFYGLSALHSVLG